MKYLLDTNICIYAINKKPESIINKFKSFKAEELGISSITLSELEYGVHKSKNKSKNEIALEEFLIPIEIYSFDTLAAEFYGKIRSLLERQGNLIGSMDLLIAAHALSLNLSLVSNNVKEFTRVPNLQVENWL